METNTPENPADNALDNPKDLNPVPATTDEIIAPLNTANLFPAHLKRLKAWVVEQLTKLEKEAWEHEVTADYSLETGIPPVQQQIDGNRIAIARHQEIIDQIENSGSKTREDRERRKASEADIKLLEKENDERKKFIKQLERVADGRRTQAQEVRLHMSFIAKRYADLFKDEKPAEPAV